MKISQSSTFSFLIFLNLLNPTSVWGQSERRTMQAHFTPTPPTIDGLLDEPVWAQVQPSAEFTQRYPDPGKPAAFETQIRVIYDNQALYIGAHCKDPKPDQIRAPVTRRDRWIDSDWFEVYLDSRHDHRSGFYFWVNPAGVRVDGTMQRENELSSNWDGVWEAKTKIVRTDAKESGWLVEMKIPYRLLRFGSGEEIVFGVNFQRHISRLNQMEQWQFISPETGLFVSGFGEIHGLRLPHSPLRWSLIPYVAVRTELTEGSISRSSRLFDVGLDGQVSLGSNTNITWTANPDFGQIEVDEVVLNLSTTETYYPEKRPFFLEDQSLYNLSVSRTEGFHSLPDVFYTRRIGRPARSPSLQDDEEIHRQAKLPRIWGAAKLAGQTESGLSIGILQALTSAEDALVLDANQQIGSRLAEPMTSYSVMRLRQDFWQRSTAGLLATSTITANQGIALSAASDAKIEFFNQDYQLQALVLTSYLTQDRYSWQDEYIQQGLDEHGDLGFGSMVSFSKIGGEHFVGSIQSTFYSKNLALNDLGYLDRANRWMTSFQAVHRRMRPFGPLASYRIKFNGWIDRNTDGVDLGDGVTANFNVSTKNNWHMGTWLMSAFAKCDDRETQTKGNVIVCGHAHRWKGGFYVSSDSRRTLAVFSNFDWSTTERGWTTKAFIDFKLNLFERIQLSLSPGYSRTTGDIRYLDSHLVDAQTQLIFATQHTEYWNLIFRATITFTTTLTLQAFAQVFLAAVDYGDKLAHPQVGTTNINVVQLEPFDWVDEADYSASSLNTSIVLRWEFLPGSVGYLVYTNAQDETLDKAQFQFGHNLDSLFQTEGQHALMLKASYFW